MVTPAHGLLGLHSSLDYIGERKLALGIVPLPTVSLP